MSNPVLMINDIHLTSVSAVWSHGDFCLDRSDLGFGLFVLGVIVPIPPHTQNIRRFPDIIQMIPNVTPKDNIRMWL